MNTPTNQPQTISPRWSSTTKLVVALTMVAILAGLVIRFRQIIGPLLISFVLAYLLYPVANFLHKRVRMSWRLASTIIFLLLFILLMGLLTLGGLAVFDQAQSLVKFIQSQITQFPEFLANLSATKIAIGPFELDFSTLNLTDLGNQLLGLVQPVLSQLGTVFGAIASGAAATIGWIFFAMLVGYFLLADSGGVQERLINLRFPGYAEDFKRIGVELGRIWNAFLRGQLIIFVLTVAIYITLLGSLNVSFYVGLAMLAGLARFVPYVGPVVAWATYGLVALFQGSTIFHMAPFPYALLVIGVAWITDVIMDNFVVPRMMGDALKVHPAAVMVAALVSANLFGIIGVILAAPVLATIKLVFNYATRKMFDLDPWEGLELEPAEPKPMPIVLLLRRLFAKIQKFWNERFHKSQKS